MSFLRSSSATAAISTGTTTVTVTGALDLNTVKTGMAVFFGSRNSLQGTGWIISTVTPSGSAGGTIVLEENYTGSTLTAAPFVISTLEFNGDSKNLGVAIWARVQNLLLTTIGSFVNGASRTLILDKDTVGALSQVLFRVAGASYFSVEQRNIAGIEYLCLRATSDGTTFVDVLKISRDGQFIVAANTGDAQFGTLRYKQGYYLGGSVDLNTLTTPGWYDGYSYTNAPSSGATHWYVEVMAYSQGLTTFIRQVAQMLNATAAETWTRTMVSGTWGAWRKIWDAVTLPLKYDGANIGIGTNSLVAKFQVSNSGAEGLEFVPAVTAGVDLIQAYNRTGGGRDTLRFNAANFQFDTGALLPLADNTQAVGGASNRWSTVYAGTGTINTSDAQLKHVLGDVSEAAIRAWGNVRHKVFQWNDARQAKGDRARKHHGLIAQDVEAAFRAEGLDPAAYALWCRDEVVVPVKRTRTIEVPVTDPYEVEHTEIVVKDGKAIERKSTRTEHRPVMQSLQVYYANGKPIQDRFESVPVTREEQEEYWDMSGTPEIRMGLRYDQCLILESAYLRARLDAAEARIAALEAQ